MQLQELKQSAIANYEDHVWSVAQSPNSPEPDGAVLHLAEKSLKEFLEDVEAIKKRLSYQGDVTKYDDVVGRQEGARQKKVGLERELAQITKEFQAKIGLVDGELAELKAQEQGLRPAVTHFMKTAPAWLQKRIADVDRCLTRTQMTLRNLHPPSQPLPLNQSLMLVPAHQQELRADLQAKIERREQRYYEKKRKVETDRTDLTAREVELKQELAKLKSARLLLRPTPEDL